MKKVLPRLDWILEAFRAILALINVSFWDNFFSGLLSILTCSNKIYDKSKSKSLIGHLL